MIAQQHSNVSNASYTSYASYMAADEPLDKEAGRGRGDAAVLRIDVPDSICEDK